jgi:hypothetical protein
VWARHGSDALFQLLGVIGMVDDADDEEAARANIKAAFAAIDLDRNEVVIVGGCFVDVCFISSVGVMQSCEGSLSRDSILFEALV